MTGISEELVRYKLPSEFCPGIDTISKLMLQDQSILNLIAKAVVSVPNNTYVTSSTSFGYFATSAFLRCYLCCHYTTSHY
ncbi:hypothetical protein RMCBS344292_13740 [Rhizopus microsporus]|nr:hypothetical protein RMCBS344292_13740 [Rhizopus microsporus]